MGKREVFDCDRCGKQNIQRLRVSFWVDRRMDAAGSSEDWHLCADLCGECLERLTDELYDTLLKAMPSAPDKVRTIFSKFKNPDVTMER